MSPADTAEFERICRQAADGKRITPAQALKLFDCHDLPMLGRAAHAVRLRLHPDPVVTYCVDRNINYTNVCITDCDFCAFYRRPGDKESYINSLETIKQKVAELYAVGGRQVLLQGGHHPFLQMPYYVELLQGIQKAFPDIHLHAFSPSEIENIALVSKLSIREVLVQLKAAGLASVPGAGGEILVDRVRQQISPKKQMSDGWLNVMRTCHEVGLRTSATMVIGHVETFADRIEHLTRLRDLQDEMHGFTAFISWTMQPEHTALAGKIQKVGPYEYMRTLTIARLFLDNFDNFQASWVTQGGKIGQLSLFYGCNDMGGTMMEENVVSAAGTVHCVDEMECRRLIEEAGFVPQKRNFFYEAFPVSEPVSA
ncbi:MAG TPA: cyclic dehypoxanthinyl futalosine synthase [Planctomycetota bacterium]|nr:cyclic dehypoxanthinyl futalosine synthase [Planctomycetota bacterium]